MIVRLRIAVLAVAIGPALGGCIPNAKRAHASVVYIDRTCTIIRTSFDEDHKVKDQSSYKDACNSIDEWQKVRTNRTKDVEGKAVVHLSYTAPQTGEAKMGELVFDGSDDEFYSLKAGEEIDILVSNTDPTKIAKA